MGFSPGEFSGGGIADAPVDGQMYGRQDAAWQPAIRKAGDTMTGPLVLPGNPTLDLQAATKQYVDAAPFVLKAGDTMTGPLVLPAFDPLGPEDAVRKLYVDVADAVLQAQIASLAAGLVYIGAYDVVLDQADFIPASGLPDGPLPPADAPGIVNGGFVICIDSGTGIGNAPPVALQRGDFLISGGPTGGPDWSVLPVGSANILADHVALSPQVAGWANVQEAVEGLNATALLSVLTNGTRNMTASLKFGSTAVATPTDLSRHIALWGTTFGFSITGGQLNHVADSGGNNVFYSGTNELARIGSGGITLRKGTSGQMPRWTDSDGSNARELTGYSAVGIGSGTGRQRVFTYNGQIWVRGVVTKVFSNALYSIQFELYSQTGSPSAPSGTGFGMNPWFLTLYGRVEAGGGSPISGVALYRNAANQGVLCVQSDGTGVGMTFYFELIRGSFLSTGGGVEGGAQLAYLTNDMTIAKGA